MPTSSFYEFKLPDIGEGVAEGEILKWMVKEGETVKEDQPLVEVMTDKVNVQIPSPKDGAISRILAREGETVKVGQAILVIETAAGGQEQAESTVVGPPSHAAGVAVEGEGEGAGQTTTPSSSSPSPSTVSSGVPPSSAALMQQEHTAAENVLATPATRRLARELDIDITKVRGSGPTGRITEEDLRNVASGQQSQTGQTKEQQQQQQKQQHQQQQQQQSVPPPQVTSSLAGEDRRIPLQGVRRIVAERMASSVHTAAHVTNVDEADMTELVLLREAFKGSAEKRGVKLTFLPFIIKAVIPALKEYPYVNSSLDDHRYEIVLKEHYNIGVATDTENGLVVPVIKDADKKDIFQIAAEIQQLAARAREGRLTLEEVRGSTFTITNQGSIGGLFATPIINYPEVAILGSHKIIKRPVVRDGKIEIRDMMYISMSFDHRVFDGAYATKFMNRIIGIVQDPKLLLAEIL